jgi:hypothetical protein
MMMGILANCGIAVIRRVVSMPSGDSKDQQYLKRID